jgi:hypothetical protein
MIKGSGFGNIKDYSAMNKEKAVWKYYHNGRACMELIRRIQTPVI